mmetsp:Transcript_9019/g.35267  ORF Transcript_9019/g.35267 Transcript_9019/m.35267 type:complete len:286 (-) Transcript_9019:984-1841(-)
MTKTVATSGATASRARRASSSCVRVAAPARHTWRNAFRTSFLLDSGGAVLNSLGSVLPWSPVRSRAVSEVFEVFRFVPVTPAATSAPILRSLASAAVLADRFFTSTAPIFGAIFFICPSPTPHAPDGIPARLASSQAARSTHMASPFFVVWRPFAFGGDRLGTSFGNLSGEGDAGNGTVTAGEESPGTTIPDEPVARPGTPHSLSTAVAASSSAGSPSSTPRPPSRSTTPNHAGKASGGASPTRPSVEFSSTSSPAPKVRLTYLSYSSSSSSSSSAGSRLLSCLT